MPVKKTIIITLGGGSLGSPVDEERSQLREPMRIAGHNEHQYFERTLRPLFSDTATSDRGSLAESSKTLARGRVRPIRTPS